MKQMLKRLSIAALFICTLSFAKAQDRQIPAAGDRAAKMTEWMKSNLNLTADQIPKVQDLNLKYAVKMDSLRSSSLAKEDKHAVMKSDGASRDAELKGILTDDQYKTYEVKKGEMKGRFKDKAKEKSPTQG